MHDMTMRGYSTREQRSKTASQRLWEKVDRNGPVHPALGSQCWVWTAGTHKGYGTLQVDGRPVRAHRMAYEEGRGTIPDGMVVMHRCDNTKCCNPDHLELGSQQDNQADKTSKGRQAKGADNGWSKLTDEDVKAIHAAAKAGEAVPSIADRFKIDDGTVMRVVRGQSWSHVSGALDKPRMIGEHHYKAKLTPESVRVIRQRHAAGESDSGIAKSLGVDGSTVHGVIVGKTWKHVR